MDIPRILKLCTSFMLLLFIASLCACNQASEYDADYERVWGTYAPDSEDDTEIQESDTAPESKEAVNASDSETECGNIVQEPGNSTTHVMSQDAVTKYIPKVSSRNILNVTFNNANIDTEGKYLETTSGICFASSPDFIAVKGDDPYTVSWKKSDLNVHIYIFEYNSEQKFIKWTNVGSTDQTAPSTIKLDAECAFIRIKLWGDIPDVSWERLIPSELQMELGSNATPYVKPIVIDTSEIDYAQIVDLIIEKGLIDHISSIDLSSTQNPLLKQIAHRGYCADGAPQCTAPAYIEAKLAGFEAGENDLWVTADGVFVMAHDTTMPSDRSVVVAESTYETLLECDMGTYKGKEVEIMTFEEWLILMKKIGLEPYVDLKSALTSEQAAEIMNIVRKHGMLDKVTWSTNSNETIKGLRAAYPYARLALLGWTEINNFVLDLRIEGRPDLTFFYPQSINVTAEVVENAHREGIGIECWHVGYAGYGFETEGEIFAEIDRVVDLGVTGICLDTYLPSEYFFEKLLSEWNIK